MAISASELRIGNWVLVDGKFIQVESVNEDGINQEIESGYYGAWETKYAGYFNDWWGNEAGLVQPIPITEEILVKCGFKEADYTDGAKYWMKDETDYSPSPYNPHNRGSATWKCYRFSQWEGDWYFSIHESNRGHHFSYQEKVNTIHRFQNLYFALTNEEIIINL